MDSEASPLKKPRTYKRKEKGDEGTKHNHVGSPSHPTGSGDESNSSPTSHNTPKNKVKGKSPRKKRPPSPLLEEEIIDGFAIKSFKTLDDLESHVRSCVTCNMAAAVTTLGTITTSSASLGAMPLDAPNAPTPPPEGDSIDMESKTSLTIMPIIQAFPAAPTNHKQPPSGPPKAITSLDKPKKDLTKRPKKSLDKIDKENNRIQSGLPTPPSSKSVSSSPCNSTSSETSERSAEVLGCRQCKAILGQEIGFRLNEDSPKLCTHCRDKSGLPPTTTKHLPNHLPKQPAIRVNGTSTNTLNSSILSSSTSTSDRSSSRDRLSDTSTHSSTPSGRGYICDSESEVESSKASDAGSEPLFTANPGKSRDIGVNLTGVCNGPITIGHTSSGSKSTVTATTTSASTGATTSTTISTSTTPTSSLKSLALPSVAPPPPPTRTPQNAQGHIIRRDIPKPIPGLSTPVRSHEDRDPTLVPPYSRSSSWHGSSPAGTPLQLSRPNLSSPHLSPVPPSLSSLPTLHNPHPPTSPFHHHPPHSSLHPHHLANQPVSMFAAPMPPPPPSLTSQPLSVPPYSPEALSSLANQDMLSRAQQELNARFLQDRGLAPPLPQTPYLRAEMHQHQHMHQHNHMHQHYGPTYPTPGTPSTQHLKSPSVLGATSPSLAELERAKFDKIPKFDTPFYRHPVPGLSSAYPGFSPMLPGGMPSGPLVGSGLQGAFTPKSAPSGMHHTQLLVSLRQEREKAATQASTVTSIKKQGKWCAAHVRIAWEIHINQQKQQAEAARGEGPKPSSEPLRPPSHLFPSGSSLHRQAELQRSSPNFHTQYPHSRSPFESGVHSAHPASFLTAPHLGKPGAPPFPRPSPYAGLGGLGTSAFGGLGSIGGALYAPTSAAGRDMQAIPGLTPPHEWNRLHRTPPSFPTPPAWPKPEVDRDKERDKEEGRDRERERERERERDRDRERHRERDLSHRNSPSRDHDRHHAGRHDVDKERAPRSRSRSPLRNGPPEGGSGVRMDLRVKEEKDVMVLSDGERRENHEDCGKKSEGPLYPGLLESHGLSLSLGGSTLGGPSLGGPTLGVPSSMGTPNLGVPPSSLFDRRGVNPYGLEPRLPPPHGLWHPFERTSLDMTQHRMELMSAMERERELMMRRLSLPHASIEQERYREQQEMMLRDRERLAHVDKERERDKDRDRDKECHERSKAPPPLKPADSYPSSFNSHSASPAHSNHNSKSNSPASMVGAPPPLIPTGSLHTNSPTPSKPTPPPLNNSVSEPSKDKPSTNGHQVESQAR